MNRTILCILVMAVVTYLIRMLPFTLVRRKIRSRFFRSLMYYIPYAVLASMTIPAIFYSTGNAATAVVGTAVAFAAGWFRLPLIAVALLAAATSFLTGIIF